MPASDKSSLQSRRFLGNTKTERLNKKKRFNIANIIPSSSSFKNFFSPKKLFATKRRKVALFIFCLVLIGAGGAFGYYEYLISISPAVVYAKKVKSMTSIIGEQMLLPTNDQPVIATVTDIKKLPKEAFFLNAQDGDKILMYKKDKEAILYRPLTGKVITYATLDFKDIIPSPTPQIAVAGASTSAVVASNPLLVATPTPVTPTSNYVPQGKILVAPH